MIRFFVVLAVSAFFVIPAYAVELAPAGAMVEVTTKVRANCGRRTFLREPIAAGSRLKLAEAWYSIAQEMYVYDSKGAVCRILNKYFKNVRVVESAATAPQKKTPVKKSSVVLEIKDPVRAYCGKDVNAKKNEFHLLSTGSYSLARPWSDGDSQVLINARMGKVCKIVPGTTYTIAKSGQSNLTLSTTKLSQLAKKQKKKQATPVRSSPRPAPKKAAVKKADSCEQSTYIVSEMASYQIQFSKNQVKVRSSPHKKCGYTKLMENSEFVAVIGSTRDFVVLSTPENYPNVYHYVEKHVFKNSFYIQFDLSKKHPGAQEIFREVLEGRTPQSIGTMSVPKITTTYWYQYGTSINTFVKLPTDHYFEVIFRDPSSDGKTMVRNGKGYQWVRTQDTTFVEKEQFGEMVVSHNITVLLWKGLAAALIGLLYSVYLLVPAALGLSRWFYYKYTDPEHLMGPLFTILSGLCFLQYLNRAFFTTYPLDGYDFPWIWGLLSIYFLLAVVPLYHIFAEKIRFHQE